MTSTEPTRLMSRLVVLGVLLMAALLLPTAAHAELAQTGHSEPCFNLCNLLQLIFPRLVGIAMC